MHARVYNAEIYGVMRIDKTACMSYVTREPLMSDEQLARWVSSNYGRYSSVTKMLTQLGWLTLHRCFICRLIFNYTTKY